TAANRSERPLPLTSATAAPSYQPERAIGCGRNVPRPVFQRICTPLVDVTTRSVLPSPFRSAATQPSPCTARSACVARLTLRNVPRRFSKSAERGRPPCASHRAVSELAYELTAKRSSRPSLL